MKKLASLLLLVAACGGTPVPPADPDPSGPTTGAGPTAPTDGGGGAGSGTSDAGTTAATTGGGTNPVTPPTTPDKPKGQAELVAAADATRGAKLYQELSCGGCHGTVAKPSTKFPNLFQIKWDDHEVHEAFEIIKKGDSPMPPFGDKVDDAQIADIVKFLQTK